MFVRQRVRILGFGRCQTAVRPVAAVACALLLAALVPCAARAQAPNLKPQGYINDFAGVLNPATRQQLTDLATELDQKTKSQLAVVTVHSLDGQPIDDYSIGLAEKWGIGSKKAGDTGVMLLLAIGDHQDRIEVGYGIEPILTDGMAGDILRSMAPDLRRGGYGAPAKGGAPPKRALPAEGNPRQQDRRAPTPRPRTTPRNGAPAGAWITKGVPYLVQKKDFETTPPGAPRTDDGR